MKAKILHYGGCKHAEFGVNQITLIAGHNAAGKTSVAGAMAAALTGSPVPAGYAKKDAVQLITAGQKQATVEIEGDEGSSSITWPECQLSTDGIPPESSIFAAGVESLMDLDQRRLVEVCAEYLESNPTQEDLAAAIPAELAKFSEKLWKTIQAQGWDGALQQRRDKGVELKQTWKRATGENYGVKKAESWWPNGWTPDLEDTTEAELQAVCSGLSAEIQKATVTEAVDDSKRAELTEMVESLPKLRADLDDASNIVRDMDDEVTKRNQELNAIPSGSSAMVCPHCAKAVQVRSGKLEAAGTVTEDDIAARVEAQKSLAAAQADRRMAGDTVRGLNAAISAAEKAERILAQPVSDPVDVEAKKQELTTATNRLHAFRSKTEADNAHASILAVAEIVRVLLPEGLRLTKLRAALAGLNQTLKEITDAAGWKPVTLTENLIAEYGGRSLNLSGSERFRVRVALQLWMAGQDESDMVIIDGADILVDKQLRNGLFTVLASEGIPALVCMALPDEKDMPDLSAAGLGESHWIG